MMSFKLVSVVLIIWASVTSIEGARRPNVLLLLGKCSEYFLNESNDLFYFQPMTAASRVELT